MGAVLGVVNVPLVKFRVNDKYCDVTIRVENKSFRCHRRRLAARSEFFSIMFNKNFRERNAKKVTLEGIHASTFAVMLKFMYTGEMIVTSKNVFGLITLSDYLAVGNVGMFCEQYLRDKMVPIPNAIGIFIFARTMKKESLLLTICEYIDRHYCTISRSDEFMDLPLDDFRTLLNRCPRLTFNWSTHSTLGIIARWISHASNDRSQYAEDLANNYIDLRFVSPQFLRKLRWELLGTDVSAHSKNPLAYVRILLFPPVELDSDWYFVSKLDSFYRHEENMRRYHDQSRPKLAESFGRRQSYYQQLSLFYFTRNLSEQGPDHIIRVNRTDFRNTS